MRSTLARESRKVVQQHLFVSEPQRVGDALLQLDRRQIIRNREEHDAVRHVRNAHTAGAVFWPLTFPLDVLVANGNTTLLWRLLAARAVGWAIILVCWLRLGSHRDLGPSGVRLFDALSLNSISILLCVMSLMTGGIESRYAGGLLVVMVVRAATVAKPWTRGIIDYLPLWVAFPLFMLGMERIDPRIAAQFANQASLTAFVLQNFLLVTAASACVVCGHATWRARREVYEARDLGRYRLKSRIGRGAMGEIWLAHHVGLRQDVALKVLACNAAREDAVARFEREVIVIARLSHPNTVRILDYGTTPEGILYYAMELLQGCDLAELIRRGGALDAPHAVDLMRQACEALAEAHRSGVVHRDIKPSNLFVATVAGQADVMKVLDFGLAKLTCDQDVALLTTDGSLLGTPCYMAPEAVSGREVDARSDVYALGCVLYELLAGRPPFEDTTIAGLLRQHSETRPVPPSHKRGTRLPAELERLVMRCLEKQPEDRFTDAEQLAAALSTCLLSERVRRGAYSLLGA
jgi:serine/threonine-protein kinase